MSLQTAQIIGLTLAALMVIIGAALLWVGIQQLKNKNHNES